VGIAGFRDVVGVRSVPVVTNWRGFDRRDFLCRANGPMVLRGLGDGAKALGWDRDLLQALGGPRLRDFLAARDAGEEGVYAAEWYLFKDHPERLDDVIAGFPEYLLDDWLESIPPPLSFGGDTRNNVYWGTAGSSTALHYDSFNGCTWNLTLKGVKRWVLFSARDFVWPSPECWALLAAQGLLTDRGLFTPETVRQYLAAPPDGFPAVTFYTADVGGGDAIYVPWRWAHQVQNITEALAVSRFYVSAENFDAFVDHFRTSKGRPAALLLRTLIGTRSGRALFRQPRVRRWLAAGRTSAPLRALMCRAMAPDR